MFSHIGRKLSFHFIAAFNHCCLFDVHNSGIVLVRICVDPLSSIHSWRLTPARLTSGTIQWWRPVFSSTRCEAAEEIKLRCYTELILSLPLQREWVIPENRCLPRCHDVEYWFSQIRFVHSETLWQPAFGETWEERKDKSQVLSFGLFMEEMQLSDFVLLLLRIMMLEAL